MVDTAIRHQIDNELRRLPVELQYRVLDFARSLAPERPRGVPGREMMRFAGLFDRRGLEEMARAIEDDCEQVDPDGW